MHLILTRMRGVGQLSWALCLPALMVQTVTLTVTLTVTRSVAQTPQQVEALVAPLLEKRQTVGLAIGTFDGTEQKVFCYGKVSAARAEPVTESTLFEIGSISKVFTATLLADLVRAKRVSLMDPVTKHLPPDVKMREQGRAVTLLDLATHTSGLPRMPNNLAPDDKRNPYVDYTAIRLHEYLSASTPLHAPGTRYEYSNLGAALLGHALARAAEQDYESLMIARICAPLQMNDTRIVLDEQQRKRLADGYDDKLSPATHWDFDVFAPAGGIRSSITDMLRFLCANLADEPSPLTDALAATHELRFENAEPRARVALGWHVTTVAKQEMLWHNGKTAGFASYMAFAKRSRTGVVVLNNAAVGVEQLGNRVLQLLVPRPARGGNEDAGERPTTTTSTPSRKSGGI